MKLKKFNEYRDIKKLSLNDLSLWLRNDDTLLINDRYGDTVYKIESMDEEGIRATNKYGTRTLLFGELNQIGEEAWEILKINDDDVFISENASFKPTPKLDILVSKFIEAGYSPTIAQNMLEVDEEHETADIYIDEEPLNFTIYPDGSIVWDDFSHSTPFGNINNPDELTKEFIDAKFQEVDDLLKIKQANGRNR